MKRIRIIILAIAVIAAIFVPSASFAANEISVVIDNVKVPFTEASGFPFIDQNGRMLVPLRLPMEQYGATVEWDGPNHTAYIKKDGETIRFVVGVANYYDFHDAGGSIMGPIDTAPVIKNGRMYIPIRYALEPLHADVGWNSNTHTVAVYSPNYSPDNTTPTVVAPTTTTPTTPNSTGGTTAAEELIRHQEALNDLYDEYIRKSNNIDSEIRKVRSEGTPYYGSESDYTRDRAELNEKIIDVQAGIAALSLDNSYEGQAKKNELNQELAELTAERDELTTAHAIKSELATLENLQAGYDEQYKQDVADENALYLSNLKKLQ